MADVNRGNRPLSPFMLGQYYRFQLTSVTSILTRITGGGCLSVRFWRAGGWWRQRRGLRPLRWPMV